MPAEKSPRQRQVGASRPAECTGTSRYHSSSHVSELSCRSKPHTHTHATSSNKHTNNNRQPTACLSAVSAAHIACKSRHSPCTGSAAAPGTKSTPQLAAAAPPQGERNSIRAPQQGCTVHQHASRQHWTTQHSTAQCQLHNHTTTPPPRGGGDSPAKAVSHCGNKQLKAWHSTAQQSICSPSPAWLVCGSRQCTICSAVRHTQRRPRRLTGKQACGCAHRPLPRYGCIFTGKASGLHHGRQSHVGKKSVYCNKWAVWSKHTCCHKHKTCSKATALTPTPTGCL